MGMTVICFHNNNEENGYLSNWYPSTFTHNGITFSSMEQYMMYRKALSFGDEKVATQILATDNAAEIKALGRLVSGYDESLWNGIRQIVVYEGLFAKFTQNPDLRERLKDTGNAFLAECAVNDRIWGIGLVPSCFGVQELMVTGVRTLFDIYTNKCSPLPEWMKAFAFMT